MTGTDPDEALETIIRVLNREHRKEIAEGPGMRKAIEAAKAAEAAYAKAREERRAADAVPLDAARRKAIEAAWAWLRKLEDDWGFDQVSRLQYSLEAVAKKPHFEVRRFLYPPLRKAVQSVRDRITRLQALKEGYRRPAEDAWDLLNGPKGVWELYRELDRTGLPASWLFRGPIMAALQAEAVKRAKEANEAVQAEWEAAKAALGEGQPEPARPTAVKPTAYTWEAIVADEVNFLAALPQEEEAAPTRERLTAQRALAIKLDGLGVKAEALYSAWKAGKLAAGNGSQLIEAEVALIAARFEAMEAPEEPPTPRPAVAVEPSAPSAAAAAGDDWLLCPNPSGWDSCQGKRLAKYPLCARCAQKARKEGTQLPEVLAGEDRSSWLSCPHKGKEGCQGQVRPGSEVCFGCKKAGRTAPEASEAAATEAPPSEPQAKDPEQVSEPEPAQTGDDGTEEGDLNDPDFRVFVVSRALGTEGADPARVLETLSQDPKALTAARKEFHEFLRNGRPGDGTTSAKRRQRVAGRQASDERNSRLSARGNSRKK